MNHQLIVLTTLETALKTFKDFTGDPDVQVQAIQTFLKVATSGNPSVEDIARTIGLNQSTASRNIKKLAVGPYAQPGYGLITVDLDRHDQRRRILSLSARGHELIRAMEEAVMPKLRHHFTKELRVKPE